MSRQLCLILDFGSQYTQLIARRVRELKVYCEIHPFNLPLETIRSRAPHAIILSGGPASCYEPGAPTVSPELFEMDVPMLGICYGMQLATRMLGGRVAPGPGREYGRARVSVSGAGGELFHGFLPSEPVAVWMSHGDRIEALAEGFEACGTSDGSPFAAAWSARRRFFGLQFHPEVAHTPRGAEILWNFLGRVAGMTPSWTMSSYADEAVEAIRGRVGEGRVICALSGGVDSAVTAALVHRAVGDRLRCIFVDNGLLRSNEAAKIQDVFEKTFGGNLVVVDAQDRFLAALRGVTDPEAKRKIIGHEFIAVFDEEAQRSGGADFLAQGTLYPDVIESVSFRGPSATIKSHHNVGGLPERMRLALVEPLRELFKDEVRELGRELELPAHVLMRQPFPGPGLAVRVLGEVTRDLLDILRAADAILLEEIRAAGFYESLWQSFAVLLPVRSVGVMGDNRTYEHVAAIRAVHSRDGMTADWAPLPHELLATVSNRIVREVRGINRVVYDITSKPPATIEWE